MDGAAKGANSSGSPPPSPPIKEPKSIDSFMKGSIGNIRLWPTMPMYKHMLSYRAQDLARLLPQEIIIRSKHHQEPPHIQVIIFMKARAHQPNIFYMHLLFNGSHDYYVCEVGWGKRRFFFFFSSSFAHLMILFAFLR